jgi:predicted hydrocarbon binding protein
MSVDPVLARLAHQPGRLSYLGSRYLLIRPETIVAMQRAVEAVLGDRAAECFAAGGRAGGGKAMADLPGEPAARIATLLATGSSIGWGRFALESFTADRLVVVVHESPFAEAYGTAETPVCHLTRGVLESLARSVLGDGWTVRETECAAVDAPACRFEAEPPRERAAR